MSTENAIPKRTSQKSRRLTIHSVEEVTRRPSIKTKSHLIQSPKTRKVSIAAIPNKHSSPTSRKSISLARTESASRAKTSLSKRLSLPADIATLQEMSDIKAPTKEELKRPASSQKNTSSLLARTRMQKAARKIQMAMAFSLSSQVQAMRNQIDSANEEVLKARAVLEQAHEEIQSVNIRRGWLKMSSSRKLLSPGRGLKLPRWPSRKGDAAGWRLHSSNSPSSKLARSGSHRLLSKNAFVARQPSMRLCSDDIIDEEGNVKTDDQVILASMRNRQNPSEGNNSSFKLKRATTFVSKTEKMKIEQFLAQNSFKKKSTEAKNLIVRGSSKKLISPKLMEQQTEVTQRKVAAEDSVDDDAKEHEVSTWSPQACRRYLPGIGKKWVRTSHGCAVKVLDDILTPRTMLRNAAEVF
ncbi:hypothetical protein GUITHDRAFT_153476 [Guillardia theta CCMP2712]|uniref:Uncharacterized protein n=1 Tax=Guillardia theta (strain CCMP2712) TaxID=905079 RepID=L1J2P0_GUITC|nr:hypothetical protein GUITHDRAFT_153476 [Guillardia theta CCMP2712]EKX42592.1 hypothetical protein GUITHDRAFT_153476 [Guillardia theta CCMP2712]|eukprot:XP_005829572.1 hypothetical protein GUITHDRAFT_153476 [Guillardia theta CCMP2712]